MAPDNCLTCPVREEHLMIPMRDGVHLSAYLYLPPGPGPFPCMVTNHGSGIAKGGAHLSWFNASSVLAFLAWFGGTGYLLTKHSNLIAIFCLAIAIAAGLAGGWIVFRFMSRLLQNTEAQMNEWDYRHEGSVGRVSISIPAGGTGEVIFEQHGIRRSAGARSDDGSSLEKGAEVVISRYEKGMAYVRKWDEFTGEKV